MARGREQLDRGQLPARELFDGFCLVIAGALLLTPGFMTDAIGLALFVPGFRDWLRQYLGRRMKTSVRRIAHVVHLDLIHRYDQLLAVFKPQRKQPASPGR